MVMCAAKRCLWWFTAVVVVVFPGLVVEVAAGESEVGTYGAPSLGVPVGARLIATSDVIVGMDPDASTLFSNPAFLATVPNSELFLTTSNWLEEMRLSAASLAFPFGQGYTLSLGSKFLYSGSLQGYDNALNVVAEESYYDLSATGALAKRFGFGLSLGFGATYLRQRLYPQDGNGYAFDAGAAFETGPYMLHAAVLNFGGTVSFSDADYTVDSQQMVGAARRFEAGMGTVFAGAQVVFASAAPTRLELAADYRPHEMFSIKAALKDVSGTQDDGLGLDAGFGIRYHKIAVDYSYTPHEYFTSTHTFSLVLSPSADGRSRTYRDEEAGATSTRASEPVQSAPVVDPAGDPRTSPARTAVSYLLVAGLHGWESSARAEARSYEVLDIPATVEQVGDKYRVVIGRYASRKDAVSALNKFKESGQKFTLVEVPAK